MRTIIATICLFGALGLAGAGIGWTIGWVASSGNITIIEKKQDRIETSCE